MKMDTMLMMLGILLVGMAILAALKYFGKMEGFQAMEPSPRQPVMRSPPVGQPSMRPPPAGMQPARQQPPAGGPSQMRRPQMNRDAQDKLNTLWQTSGCQNQQLLGEMRKSIDVLSNVKQIASNETNEKCTGAVQQFKSMMQTMF